METEVAKKKMDRKIFRKQNRCKNILKRHENLEAVDFPTKIILVGNGGLVCGIQREMILETFSPFGVVNNIVMVPDKPYSFVVFEDEKCSQHAMSSLNGHKLNGSDLAMYLCYVNDVPKVSLSKSTLPPGLHLVNDFINEEDELELLSLIDFNSEDGVMKHRRVKHFGYEFNYSNNNVDKDRPLKEKIPVSCHKHLEKLLALGHISRIPDQLTVNQYLPGQGIPPHIDTHSAFEEEIISFSLGSQVVMDFCCYGKDIVPVLLPQRSVLIMTGESRYLWKHGITPRKTDVIPVFEKDICHLTLNYRLTRTSFTFRSVRQSPCNCVFSEQCDSQNVLPKLTQGDIVAELEAGKFEAQYVTEVYENIADHFSMTRYKPWPLVAKFIDNIPVGSILIDAGCGNGKNMNVNRKIYQVGCDISMNLAQLCANRNLQVIVGDVLKLPFRDECGDVCICIAVIHHMATKIRRLQAVNEIIRVLRPGGKALIYVWSLEQETSNGPSNYLSHSKIAKKKDQSHIDSEESHFAVTSRKNNINFPIHENRTHFKQQDVFVPWHNKANLCDNSDGVYHRYYHVFRKGELETLIDESNVQIVNSYYDKGNWCVVFQKKMRNISITI